MPKLKMDRSILEAALVGLGHKMGELTLRIAEIKRDARRRRWWGCSDARHSKTHECLRTGQDCCRTAQAMGCTKEATGPNSTGKTGITKEAPNQCCWSEAHE